MDNTRNEHLTARIEGSHIVIHDEEKHKDVQQVKRDSPQGRAIEATMDRGP